MRRPHSKLHLKLSFGLLSVLLLLGAILAFALALIFLKRSHTIDAEVGKWLLTVAAAFVFTGALSLAVKAIDQRRSERQEWHGVLRDLAQ
jgi:hypothetical protein